MHYYRFHLYLLTASVLSISPSTVGAQELSAEPVITTGLSQPVFVTAAPGDEDRLFVVERTGDIRVFDLQSNTLLETPYLSVSVSTVGSGGLLGLAFDPNFASNGRFYTYSTKEGSAPNLGNIVIERFTANGDPLISNSANEGSAHTLLTIEGSQNYNHNGGWIGFRPNDANRLYMAVGDGGLSNDNNNNAQNVNKLFGKLLRIDVGGDDGYTIPAGNMMGGRPEVYSIGLRNPWRASFDRSTSDLYIGDVGQDVWEEVNFQAGGGTAAPAGGLNYGWRAKEGSRDNPAVDDPFPADAIDPLYEYPHGIGYSITGGYVYRGTAIPELQGQYFFGDFIFGRIWSGERSGNDLVNIVDRSARLGPAGGGPAWPSHLVSFGEDARGELYMVGINGVVYRMAAEPDLELFNAWTGGGDDDNWTTVGNWGSATPVPPAALVFAGSTRITPNNDFPAHTPFNAIAFHSNAGAFTLGGNPITLTAADSAASRTGGISNNSTSLQTINVGLTLATGVHGFSGGTGGLALNPAGGLVRDPGGVATFAPESGGISTTMISNTNGILGGWSRVGNGLTAGWASVDTDGQIVPFSNYTTVSGGGMIASNPSSNVDIAVAGSPVTMATEGTTDINTLRYNVKSAVQSVEVGAGNTLRLGTMGGILRTGTTNDNGTILEIGVPGDGSVLTAGGPSADTPGEIVLDTGTGSRSEDTAINISSIIADNGAGAVRLIKTGFASAVLHGANMHTGGTYVVAGRLEVRTTPNTLGSTSVTVTPGGQVFLNSPAAAGAYTQAFQIAGNGTAEAGGLGAIRLGPAAVDGTVTLHGDARISRFDGAATINGRITGGFDLELGGYDSDAISVVQLTNTNNDWTGDTQIRHASVVRLGASEVLPHGAGKGDLVFDVSSDPDRKAILDLNGFNETINGASRVGSTGERAVIQNSKTNTLSTLTLGGNDHDSSFDGTIEGPHSGKGDIALTKVGIGRVTLAGLNHYQGGTTIEAGELAVTGRLATQGLGGASGPVLINTSPTSGATLSGRGDGATTGLVGNVMMAAINNGNRARIAPGTTGTPGADQGPLVVDSLTVGNGAQLLFDLLDAAAPIGNDQIHRNTASVGTVSFDNSAQIVVSGGSAGEYVLVDNHGTPISYAAGVGAITLVPNTNPLVRPAIHVLYFGEADKIKVNVTGGSLPLVWNGTAESATWDINDTQAWTNVSNQPDVFFNNDAVTFNDIGTVKTVELDGPVRPASIRFATSGGTYTLQDVAGAAGTIAGTAAIDMSPSTTATLIVTANLQNSGSTTIGSGNTLQVGASGESGQLGAGNIGNNGTLAFNRSDSLTVANLIHGVGQVRQDGTGVITLSGANAFSGGLTLNEGTVRLTNPASAGSGLILVDSDSTLVGAESHTNPVLVIFGRVAARDSTTLFGEFTAYGPATIYLADPQDSDINGDVTLAGTLVGSANSGQISVQAGTSNSDPHAGPGFRLRGTGASTYAGTITASSRTKVELQTNSIGPFSPAGTGKIVLTGGVAALDGSTTGTYSQLLLRNNSSGSTIFGNDVRIAGLGMAIINLQGSAPSSSASMLGNLRIGGGQTLGITSIGDPLSHVAAFNNVTLTGGDVSFAPSVNGFGSTTVVGADLALGNIEEIAPSGVTMAGLATLIMQGTGNYSGSTTITSGTLRLATTGSLNNNAPVIVANGALLLVEGTASIGTLSGDGATSVKGGGQIAANHFRQNGLTVSGAGAKATVRANGSDSGTSVVSAFDLNPSGLGGVFDLNNNDLVVRATAATKDAVHGEIEADIVTAQNGLDANLVTKWDGPGLTSSAARAANVGTGFDLIGLGVIRNSDLDVTTGIPNSSYTSFSGQAVTPDAVLVKYTYVGDANLSGAVSFDDYVGMDNAFFGLIPNLGWATGDINFDNVINFDDYSKVDQAFFFQGAPLVGAPAATVPEPRTIVIALLAALCVLSASLRRR